MSTERATALVVRGTDWSETSRIVTLWTREFGKVRALAKGGRRLRSSFEVAFDLLTVSHVVFIKKHSGGLDLLTEAQVAERFPHLRTDLSALYVGYYVAELLADGTQDYDPHPALFDASLETLRKLDPGERGALAPCSLIQQGANAPRSPDHPGLVSAFELVWLRELGYSPRLDACAGCGRSVPDPPPVRLGYSPAAGGVLCTACRPTARDHRSLSAPAWAALRAMASGESHLPGDVRQEVRQALGQTVSYVLGRRPRLLGYVDGT